MCRLRPESSLKFRGEEGVSQRGGYRGEDASIHNDGYHPLARGCHRMQTLTQGPTSVSTGMSMDDQTRATMFAVATRVIVTSTYEAE